MGPQPHVSPTTNGQVSVASAWGHAQLPCVPPTLRPRQSCDGSPTRDQGACSPELPTGPDAPPRCVLMSPSRNNGQGPRPPAWIAMGHPLPQAALPQLRLQRLSPPTALLPKQPPTAFSPASRRSPDRAEPGPRVAPPLGDRQQPQTAQPGRTRWEPGRREAARGRARALAPLGSGALRG